MSPRGRQPWVAVVLSLLCTGLGHLYCGRTARGLALFLLSLLFAPAAILVAFLPPSDVLFWLLVAVLSAGPLLLLFAVADSFRIARKLRDRFEPREYQRIVVYALFVLAGLAGSAGSAVFLRSQVIGAYRIATESMEPSLRKGDLILVSKLQLSRPLRRGAVVVFRPPGDPDRCYVKRIAGLPGDRIEVRDGRVLVNGEAWPCPESAPADTPDLPEGVVPQCAYFLVGDDLANSKDSRQFGAITRGDIVGLALYVIGSDHVGSLPAQDR